MNVSEIVAMPSVTQTVLAKTTAGDYEINVTGADLAGLLAAQGMQQKDLTALRLMASDGYSIEIPTEILAQRQILLVYQVDGQPLNDEQAPIWVVIPEERAMYWVKQISDIYINESAADIAAKSSKIIFMETLFAGLSATDYEGQPAVSGAALLSAAGLPTASAKLKLRAADGLEKIETADVFSSALLTTTGEKAPRITGGDIPKGMRVRNLLSVKTGAVTAASFQSCRAILDPVTLGDRTGMAVNSLFDLLGMGDAEAYVFMAIDGNKVEISKTGLAKGLIFINDEGVLQTSFDGLPKNTGMCNLLSVAAK